MRLNDMYRRPGFLLRRAHQISSAVFETACADAGLTQAQYGALVILATSDGIDQTRLARALGFDKVTLLRVLRGLEERGLVVRCVSPTSRKHLALSLTPAGVALLEAAEEPAARAYETLMSAFSEEDGARFITLLEQMVQTKGAHAKAEWVPITAT